jgi:phenylalanyl-tRNA synthetase beta chain
MKISYNWLKQYINTDLSPQHIAEVLTNTGLEVEAIETIESIKGGLEGLLIGEVVEKQKHPNADKLNITKVDVGTCPLLQIVCGAGNVEVGQKIVVATIGTKLYPINGEPFKIKKSNIRGIESEGMICAEDEIGIGKGHDGIMVLNSDAAVGSKAAEYFKIETDFQLEIGLTPNRADAFSHFGVARDLAAALNLKSSIVAKLPQIKDFSTTIENRISVVVEDYTFCQRYSGILIDNITVTDSPDWLKTKLQTIGLRPINNIVDVTNYVLHELGQPLHAFDADKIAGSKIIVRKAKQNETFITLDDVTRNLNTEDLLICDSEKPLCIAGVFGGKHSGVTSSTKSIFIESAYFNAVSVRKTAKHHGLSTDASFRFERGTDPNITVFALRRAATIFSEILNNLSFSEITDLYPTKVENFKIDFSYTNCEKLIGMNIPNETIDKILYSLDITIVGRNNNQLQLSVPPYRVDVYREADVIEEILRIYGCNNITIPEKLNTSVSYSLKPDNNKIQNNVSDFLVSKGFLEIMNNSLTKVEYRNLLPEKENETVTILNPLSTDLLVLREELVFNICEVVSYNINRKSNNLKLFEFGKIYKKVGHQKYFENFRLSIALSGKLQPENWDNSKMETSFYELKFYATALIEKMGYNNISLAENNNTGYFEQQIDLLVNKRKIGSMGAVKKSILNYFDIKQQVFYAELNFEELLKGTINNKIKFKELPKFQSVRRDLSLLVDTSVYFEDIKRIAMQADKNLLKEIGLFDVYEGKNLAEGKKSYAVSFLLQDEEATLKDSQIEHTMGKIQKQLEEKLGAILR